LLRVVRDDLLEAGQLARQLRRRFGQPGQQRVVMGERVPPRGRLTSDDERSDRGEVALHLERVVDPIAARARVGEGETGEQRHEQERGDRDGHHGQSLAPHRYIAPSHRSIDLRLANGYRPTERDDRARRPSLPPRGEPDREDGLDVGVRARDRAPAVPARRPGVVAERPPGGGTVPGVPPLRARPDLLRLPVGGQWIVFDPHRSRAHLLNPSAALVLDQLDGERDLDAVVRACSPAVAGRTPKLVADVATAIDEFVAEGLAGPDGAAVDDHPIGPAVSTDERIDDVIVPHRTRAFRGIETAFDIATDDQDLTGRLDHLLGALADEDPPDERHHYVIATGATAATIALDGSIVVRLPPGPLVVQYLLWHIDRLVTATTRHHLLLHAGAVSSPAGIAVLAGVMNSGKSTLTAALVRDGLAFVTDEMVAIDTVDHLVTPFPRPITLESGSWALFDETAADGRSGQTGSRRYLDPPTAPARVRRPITHLVFPQFLADTELELTPVAPADAAIELVRHTFALDAAGLAALVDLVERVPSVRLRHPGIDVAVPALRAWIG
jgi:hypothetical protein